LPLHSHVVPAVSQKIVEFVISHASPVPARF
jgi:hypothetical protein